MNELFYELFDGLPRLGPGSDKATIRALHSIPIKNNKLEILDIGCGTGAQTLLLANQLEGKITAIDNYQPYLEKIAEKSHRERLKAEIQYLCTDMKDMNFKDHSFDLVWSEGSIYIIGFKTGMELIYPMLKKNGYAVFSDLNFLKSNPPDELNDFFKLECPEMISKKENIKLVQESKYNLIYHFELDRSDHWIPYYEPLQQRVHEYALKYEENSTALEISNSIQQEIDLFNKYADYYGYVFYIMQKKN